MPSIRIKLNIPELIGDRVLEEEREEREEEDEEREKEEEEDGE